ncbi:WbqC family protein [Vibrio coralliirubri]|uniref:WbqC family protein n=1 Tax=Vibrio coralliirubri TaxID=1516159 RepID=UPI000634A8FB|nr:WbqC family protein [Vibrio coralliirubri]CDU11012.1 WbqC-like protein family protein [Vibrio coralliirubri]
MKKIAILQSNYIPWKGVFDMINQVDTFVFFEDVDYTNRDWRTRNKIRTNSGSKWLTVPVKKMPRGTKICDIRIANDGKWQKKHKSTISQSYSKAKYFQEYKWILDDIYDTEWDSLSDFNIYTTKLICNALDIRCNFVNSKDIESIGVKDDKLISICKSLSADYYLSGPSAKNYIDNDKFEEESIELAYIDYSGYPEYSQVQDDFEHYVSVLDVIFNCGPDSRSHIVNN